MIEYKRGDMLKDDAEAIVNTVNCVGVMGRGLALQFKKLYPGNFDFYEAACKRKEALPGKMLVYKTDRSVNPRYIINFPTKRHWRGSSRVEDIETGLADLVGVVLSYGIASIAIPPLGCGLGGLEWGTVRCRIESAFAGLANVNVTIYEPHEAQPAEEMARRRKVPEMTTGRAALVGVTKRYIDGQPSPSVTLLEIHKLLYFLQECGEPLRLEYVKRDHGPFATNLFHVLTVVEGYLLSGYSGKGERLDKRIQIVPGAAADANAFLEHCQGTMRRIDRVAELVDGFEPQHGLELLTAVHWVAKNEAVELPHVVDHIHAWSPQKQKFSQRQIETAFERLHGKGWLPSSPRQAEHVSDFGEW